MPGGSWARLQAPDTTTFTPPGLEPHEAVQLRSVHPRAPYTCHPGRGELTHVAARLDIATSAHHGPLHREAPPIPLGAVFVVHHRQQGLLQLVWERPIGWGDREHCLGHLEVAWSGSLQGSISLVGTMGSCLLCVLQHWAHSGHLQDVLRNIFVFGRIRGKAERFRDSRKMVSAATLCPTCPRHYLCGQRVLERRPQPLM